ncbi:APC family permease [Fluviispira multicolorata]|uniref:Amino acid permease n=1 Tax=Fluviispira multicolorata TaxID=2654512 RepID=A0A833JFL4_9BACT|nr:APC family permease [Fluviispira multicolorata]KAB8031075.1 amino acid permease [Fluviispira multicolorata]
MKKITLLNLLFFSLGSIIGSGWLYGAYYTSKLAGNAAIISWIIGGLMMAIVALSYAEIILNKQFNNLPDAANHSLSKNGSILVSILTWIWTALIPPIEVQATIQYASNYFTWIRNPLTQEFTLSKAGLFLSFFLLFIMFFINIFASNTVGRFNKLITIVKVIIPISVAFIFFYVIYKNPYNAYNNLSLDFFSEGVSGMLTAISTGGIAFSFIGFQTAIFLAKETDNPQKNIPIAVFGSIFIAIIIYLLIQIGFNLSIPSDNLNNGWSQLNFAGDSGPIAGLLALFGFVFMSYFLYFDAVISPFGTGLGYKVAASRVLSNLSEEKIFPKFLSQRNKFGSPYFANTVNFILGAIFLCSVSGWQSMIAILCGLIILTMSYVPLYVLYARLNKYNDTSFKVKNYKILSFLSFYFCNLMLIWCEWNQIKYVLSIFSSIFIFLIIKDILKNKFNFNLIFHAILPIHAFLIGMITYLKTTQSSFYFETVSLFIISLVIILTVIQIFKSNQSLTNRINKNKEKLVS